MVLSGESLIGALILNLLLLNTPIGVVPNLLTFGEQSIKFFAILAVCGIPTPPWVCSSLSAGTHLANTTPKP